MKSGDVYKGEDGRYYKSCPSCGEIQSYLRKSYAEESLRLKKECKSCSNKKTENCGRGLYKNVRISWFNKYKCCAELRGLSFNIEIEDIQYLFEKQDFRCAISGAPIDWSNVGSIHTASIDRIDSSVGYEKENIHLVHKDVNMMKQSYSLDFFIDMCNKISDYNKIKW